MSETQPTTVVEYRVMRCFHDGARIRAGVRPTRELAQSAARDTLYNCNWCEVERVETHVEQCGREDK